MSQEVDANVLDLVEQIGFYLYEYMSENLKKDYQAQESFIARC